ncbi:MAG: C10 family peptidase [Muribaculaceae bacterium]|nr:C10 family peptidase [Muribaculaceae bacterium]
MAAYARQISPQEAASVASEFLSGQTSIAAEQLTTRSSNVESSKVGAYHIINYPSGGFVIVGGDDRMAKIIGYSDKGQINTERLPLQLKNILEGYEKVYAELKGNDAMHNSWATTLTRASEEVVLNTANWNQFWPYNVKAPQFNEENGPIGCVATALAIIMKYNEYPVKVVTPFKHKWFSEGTPHTYDFGNMNLNYSLTKNDYEWGETLSKEEEEAVAEILYAAAATVNMQFGNGSSSATLADKAHRLREWFGFSPDCQYICRSYFNDEKWHSLVKEQISHKMPVLYEGYGGGGHTFVLDGYNSEGLFHINWGWGGYENGFFRLDDLKEYNNRQGMIINLKPADDPYDYLNKYSRIWVDSGSVFDMTGIGESAGLRIDREIIESGVPFRANLGVPTWPNDFEGYDGLALIDESDKIIEVAQNSVQKVEVSIYDWYVNAGRDWTCYGVKNWYDVIFSSPIKDTYKLAYVAKENNDSDWKLVFGSMDAPTIIPVTGNKPGLVEISYKILHGDPSKITITPPDRQYMIGDYFYNYNDVKVSDGIVAEYENGNLVGHFTPFRATNDGLAHILQNSKEELGLYYMGYDELIEKSYHVTTPGTLASMISEEDKMKIGTIHLSGDLKGEDMDVVADLPFLLYLDMENVHFVEVDRGDEIDYEDYIPRFAMYPYTRSFSPLYERIKFPKNLKGFGQISMATWNAEALDLPESVEAIGYGALQQLPEFSSLHFVNVNNPKPIKLEAYNFAHSDNNLVLFVPQGTKASYQNDSGWSAVFNEIREVDPDSPFVGEYVDEENVRYLILADCAAVVGFRGKSQIGSVKDFVEYNGKQYPVEYGVKRKLNAPENLVANTREDFNWHDNYATNVYYTALNNTDKNIYADRIFYPGGARSSAGEEMFTYEIDKEKSAVRVTPNPMVEGVKITSVVINGQEYPANDKNIYLFSTRSEMNVKVNYTLFDTLQFSTEYDDVINNKLPQTNIDLASVEEMEADIDMSSPVRIYDTNGKLLFSGMLKEAGLAKGFYVMVQNNKAKLIYR